MLNQEDQDGQHWNERSSIYKNKQEQKTYKTQQTTAHNRHRNTGINGNKVIMENKAHVKRNNVF